PRAPVPRGDGYVSAWTTLDLANPGRDPLAGHRSLGAWTGRELTKTRSDRRFEQHSRCERRGAGNLDEIPAHECIHGSRGRDHQSFGPPTRGAWTTGERQPHRVASVTDSDRVA